MNRFKLLFLSALLIFTAGNIFAQEEQEPQFPGGIPAFYKFISNNLKYPQVANIVGLSGKVTVSFVIERDGTVSNVRPVKCLGAGCESEAVRIVSISPGWTPGKLNGKTVRVQFTVPISFNMNGRSSTTMRSLKRSDYGFVFYIKGNTYTVDEAETILGKSFDPTQVENVEDYDNPKYVMPDKKGVYLIIIKNG